MGRSRQLRKWLILPAAGNLAVNWRAWGVLKQAYWLGVSSSVRNLKRSDRTAYFNLGIWFRHGLIVNSVVNNRVIGDTADLSAFRRRSYGKRIGSYAAQRIARSRDLADRYGKDGRRRRSAALPFQLRDLNQRWASRDDGVFSLWNTIESTNTSGRTDRVSKLWPQILDKGLSYARPHQD